MSAFRETNQIDGGSAGEPSIGGNLVSLIVPETGNKLGLDCT
jgi:hypothetical protein